MAKYGDKGYHTEKLENGEEVKFVFTHLGTRETIKFIARTEGDPEKRMTELLEHVIRFDGKDPSEARVTWDWLDEQPNSLALTNNIGQAAFLFLAGVGQKQA